jgi:hypothetical protein
MRQIWSRIYCDEVYGGRAPFCQEFSPKGMDAEEANTFARSAGWEIKDDIWLCPECVRRHKVISLLRQKDTSQ